MDENFPSERHKLTDSRSWVKPKQDEPKEIQAQTFHDQTVEKLKAKKKFWKKPEKEGSTIYTWTTQGTAWRWGVQAPFWATFPSAVRIYS